MIINKLLAIKNINANSKKYLNLNFNEVFLKKLTRGKEKGPIESAEKTKRLLLVPTGEDRTARTIISVSRNFLRAKSRISNSFDCK